MSFFTIIYVAAEFLYTSSGVILKERLRASVCVYICVCVRMCVCIKHKSLFFCSVSGSEQCKVSHAECSGSFCTSPPRMQGRGYRWRNHAACKPVQQTHRCTHTRQGLLTESFYLFMSQVSDFKEQLLLAAGVPNERIAEFSCGECV